MAGQKFRIKKIRKIIKDQYREDWNTPKKMKVDNNEEENWKKEGRTEVVKEEGRELDVGDFIQDVRVPSFSPYLPLPLPFPLSFSLFFNFLSSTFIFLSLPLPCLFLSFPSSTPLHFPSLPFSLHSSLPHSLPPSLVFAKRENDKERKRKKGWEVGEIKREGRKSEESKEERW